MYELPISEIGVHQIVSLIPELFLKENEEELCNALEFRVPTLEELFEYARNNLTEMRKINPMKDEKSIRLVMKCSRPNKKCVEMKLREYRIMYSGLNDDDKKILTKNHYFYWGHITTLQRRLLRYTSMLLAIDGLLNEKLFSEISKDLMECDIILSNVESVRNGKNRIIKSLNYVLKIINEYMEKAKDISNYLKIVVSDEWMMESDNEKFGFNHLCFSTLFEYICNTELGDMYINLTKNQVKEIEKNWNDSLDKNIKNTMSSIFLL